MSSPRGHIAMVGLMWLSSGRSTLEMCIAYLVGWFFRLNGPLRQYVSLYRAVSQRKKKINDRRQKKMFKHPLPELYAYRIAIHLRYKLVQNV